MAKFVDTQHSPYSPRQVYDLVADVKRYPEFLPWCRAARILEWPEPNIFLAELVIAYKQFRESYTSRVELLPGMTENDLHVINVRMVQGPFHHLTNGWKFLPEAGGGTQIEFELDFAFRSSLLEKMIGGFFGRAAGKMGEAFKQRADQLYG